MDSFRLVKNVGCKKQDMRVEADYVFCYMHEDFRGKASGSEIPPPLAVRCRLHVPRTTGEHDELSQTMEAALRAAVVLASSELKATFAVVCLLMPRHRVSFSSVRILLRS